MPTKQSDFSFLGIVLAATLALCCSFFSYAFGRYNGKWDTIAAYKNANFDEGDWTKESVEQEFRKTFVLSPSNPHISFLNIPNDVMEKDRRDWYRSFANPQTFMDRLKSDGWYPEIIIRKTVKIDPPRTEEGGRDAEGGEGKNAPSPLPKPKLQYPMLRVSA